MSLITLKNDAQQSPWNFRNYFRDPIVLPPKSSVSLNSAVVYKGEEVDTEENNTGMVMVGDIDSGLNPAYPFVLPLNANGGTTFTPVGLAQALKSSVNGIMGQPAYADNLNGTETFNAEYISTSKKIIPTFTQKTLPPLAPYSQPLGNTNGIFFNPSTTVAGATRVVRNGLPYNPAGGIEPVQSATWGQSVPRNGGVLLFQFKQNALGQYSPGTSVGLGMTTSGGSDEGSYAVNNPLAPVGIIRVATYGPGGTTPSRCRVDLNEGDLENANYVTLTGAITTLDPANIYTFAFYWDGPYSIALKYSTNYAPPFENPANVWIDVYSMKGANPTKSVPTFVDNLSVIVRAENTSEVVDVLGTLGNSAYWDWETDADIGGRDDILFEIADDAVFTDTLEGVYPAQFLKKDIRILNDTEANDFPLEQQFWDVAADVFETELGKLLGWSNGGDAPSGASLLLSPATAGQYQIWNANPSGTVANTNLLPTLHIQLTNFGIDSKNGAVSNNVKDVAVIPQFNINTEDKSSLQHLYYQSGYENRINLNNLQELTINQIDCLLTYDNNTEAVALEDFTTLIIKFHKGKED